MRLPFIHDVEWEPRRVRNAQVEHEPESTQRDAADEPIDREVTDLIPPQDRPRIVGAYDNTIEAANELERQALEGLREQLHIDVSQRPSLRKSLGAVTGQDVGDGRRPISDSDTIDANEVNARVFERSYDIMENAGTLMLGFDAQDLLREDGDVRPIGAVTSPAQAAGERAFASQDAVPMAEAVEEKTTISQREIAFMAFLWIIFFVLRAIADMLDNLADKVSGALSIRILRKRIGIGGIIAKPFRWLASLFRRVADRFEERAMGQDASSPAPATPAPPDGSPSTAPGPPPPEDPVVDDPDDDEVSFDESSDIEAPAAADMPLPPSLDTDRFAGSSGINYVMGAQHVLQAAAQEAGKEGNETLARHMIEYDQARASKRNAASFRSIGESWGVDFERDRPDTQATATTARPEDEDDPFDC